MKTNLWLKTVTAFFMVMVITLSVFQVGSAGPGAKGFGGGNVVYDPVTGALAFVGTNPGQPVPSLLSNPSAAPARANAESFANSFASQMGLSSVSANLALTRTAAGSHGRSTVRFHQVYQGLNVFASDV